MPVPYTFGTRTSAIPLSELDANFNTPVTIGNTTVGLGNTVTSVGNLTLTNVTITSGTINASVVDSGYTANAVIYANSTGVLTDGSANLTFNGTTLTTTGLLDSGNLTFTGTGNRITGDFSNATFANRVAFQTSTANSATTVLAIPSGTGTTASWDAYNNSDPTNSGYAQLTALSTEIRVAATIRGTGTYLPLTMYTGGSERLRIDTSGNVGIGTTSPTARVHSVITTGSTTLPLGRFEAAIGAYTGTSLIAANTLNPDSSYNLFSCIADSDGDAGGPYTQFLVRGDGNVGIGTSSPSYPLQVVKNANGAQRVLFSNNSSGSTAETVIAVSNGTAEGSIRVAGTSYGGYGAYTANNTLIYNDTSAITIMADNATNGIIKFATGSNSERMRIDTSGNVGINTTSPGVKLGVVDTSAGTITFPAIFGNRGTTNSTEVFLGLQTYDSGTAGITNGISSVTTSNSSGAGSADLKFWTTNAATRAERMRITSGGTLIVNDTATSSFFDGRVSSFSATLPGLSGKTSGGAAMPAITSWNTATSGDNLFLQFATETTATARGSIDYNRGAGLVRYNTTSDATLKNIIGDSDGKKSIDILKSTRIREYAWKDDAEQKPQIGVIAQELYETYKGAVSVGGEIEKTDEQGNVTTQYNAWTVDKTAFTFHLIAGWQAHEKLIQEQQAMIEELKQEVAKLKGAK